MTTSARIAARSSRSGQSTFGRTDELASCRFCIDIQGLWVAVFTECSGLSGQIEVETFQEGGLNDYEHKLPGRVTYGNVTLKGGVASTLDLWDWFKNAAMGDVRRRDLSIVMYSQSQQEQMRWNLLQAYPVQWQGPDFSAGSTEVAVHSLELAHHGLSLSQP